MQLFVKEEHRHAEILAICIRNLGGNLIRQNWTARLFVFGRRLIGLRLKVLVLLAAEVVGICYYHLLATRLPPTRLKSLLAQLVNDERAHDKINVATRSIHLYMACDDGRGSDSRSYRSSTSVTGSQSKVEHRAAAMDYLQQSCRATRGGRKDHIGSASGEYWRSRSGAGPVNDKYSTNAARDNNRLDLSRTVN